jgi:hypothetical protein
MIGRRALRQALGTVGRLALAMGLALTVSAGSLVVLFAQARPASACVADTDGDCWNPNYQTWRTDGSLAVWTGPGIGSIESWLGGNGSKVEVICQALGKTEDGLPYTVWDQMDDGGWVYDYYITTPGDGYHPVLTLCNDSPPPQATNITATQTGTSSVHVTWQDNSNGTAQYLVGNGTTSQPSSPLPAGTTSYDWTNLGPNTTTCFNVLALNVFGNQGWSVPRCATTLPAVPGNVTATALTAHTVRVTWTAPPGGAADYIIGDGYALSAEQPSAQTSYLWRGAPASTYLCFSVSAVDIGGQGNWATSSCLTTPAAPANDYVNLGDSLSSGEGTQDYTTPTNIPGNQCHRSNSSYSSQYLGMTSIYKSVDNVACSGAVISEYYGADTPKNNQSVPDAGELAQRLPLNSNTDLVTLSFGINNVHFADLLNTCYGDNVGTIIPIVSPDAIDACFIDKLTNPQTMFGGMTLSAFIDAQQTDLEQLYRDIKGDAQNAQIFVVTYPLVFPTTFNGADRTDANSADCSDGVLGGAYVTSQQQLTLIYQAEDHLDSMIRNAALAVGGIQVVDVEKTFAGHDICAGDPNPGPWANVLILNGTTPGNDSFHPNTTGYYHIALKLKSEIGF